MTRTATARRRLSQVTQSPRVRRIVAALVVRLSTSDRSQLRSHAEHSYATDDLIEAVVLGLCDPTVPVKAWAPWSSAACSRLRRRLGLPPRRRGLLAGLEWAGVRSPERLFATGRRSNETIAKRLGCSVRAVAAKRRTTLREQIERQFGVECYREQTRTLARYVQEFRKIRALHRAQIDG